MKIEEAGRQLGLRPWTVREKCRSGQLVPAFRIHGEWEIPQEAIDAYQRNQRQAGASAATRVLLEKGLLSV